MFRLYEAKAVMLCYVMLCYTYYTIRLYNGYTCFLQKRGGGGDRLPPFNEQNSLSHEMWGNGGMFYYRMYKGFSEFKLPTKYLFNPSNLFLKLVLTLM